MIIPEHNDSRHWMILVNCISVMAAVSHYLLCDIQSDDFFHNFTFNSSVKNPALQPHNYSLWINLLPVVPWNLYSFMQTATRTLQYSQQSQVHNSDEFCYLQPGLRFYWLNYQLSYPSMIVLCLAQSQEILELMLHYHLVPGNDGEARA